MATQANVTLRFLMSGANSVMGIMDRISGKKRDLEHPVDVPIKANDTEAQVKFDSVKRQLDELNNRVATAKLDAKDNAGKAKIAEFKLELRRVNDYVARPTITDRGLDRTEARLLGLLATLDRIDHKNASPNVGLLGRLGGAIAPGFQGVSGVGSGASAVAIQALTSPVGAATAAASIPFAGTALGGGIIGAAGAGLAGLGIAGALGAGNKGTSGQLSQAQGALQAAQLRQTAAQDKLNKLQGSSKTTAAQLAQAQSVLASASASVAGAQDRLNKVRSSGIKQDNAATDALHNLEGTIRQSLSKIGQSFIPVLAKIFNSFSKVFTGLTPVIAAAEKQISGPFQKMGVVLAQSLGSPSVVKSIQAVAKAFSDFLVVFTPQIPGIVNSLAGGITGIATAFTDHPGMIVGMANVVDFLLKLPGYVFSAIGALVRVTSWMTSGFPHDISIGLDAARGFFIGVGHQIESVWDVIWNHLRGAVSTTLTWISAHWKLILGILLGPIVVVPALIVKYWNDIKAPFVAGYNFIIGVYHSIMNWVTSNFDKWWSVNGDAIKTIWRNVWAETLVIFHQFFDPIVTVVRTGLSIVVSLFRGNMGAVRGVVTVAWGVIRGLFVGGMQAIKLVWQVGWAALRGVASIMWTNIQAFIRIGWAAINLLWKASIGILVASWRIMWSVILNVAKVVWTLTKNAIKGIWDIIVGLFGVFINVLTGHWHAALIDMKNMGTQIWNLTKGSLQAIWNAIRSIGQAIWNALRAYLVGLWNNTKSAAITIWNATKTAIVNIWHSVVNTGKTVWNDFFGWLRSGWHNVVSSAGTIWNGLKAAVMNPVRTVAHFLASLFAGIDDITNFVGLHRPLDGAVKALRGMAAGGKINQGTHETADDVLIRVSKNETVLSARHSKLLSPLLGEIGVPGYAGGKMFTHYPGVGDAPVDWRKATPGLATGGQVEQAMLNFMLSKRGQSYSEANRWGEPPWDCSSLVWQAAHNAGVPIPKSQAIAASEADWFSNYSNTFMYGNRMQAQTGDIIFSTGAAPGRSKFGGIGHVGMAANSSTLISALGTKYGVTTSNLGSGFVVGARLGGAGGKNILSSIGSFIAGAVRSLGDIFSGLGRFATAGIDLAKGDTGGAMRAILGIFKPTAGGAAGMLGKTLLGIPGTLTADVVKFIVNKVKSYAAGQQGSGGVPGGPPASGPLQAYAKKLLAQYGWSNQWGAFADIVARESGWRVNATNASSGAYGIPQALPGSKMASAGADWRTSGYTQLRWMMAYIKSRWGNPANADAHERSAHWYANGTKGAARGWAMVGERGRELVHFNGGEQVVPNHDLGMFGYASGTTSNLVAAEIAKLRAEIAKYRVQEAHAKTAVQRNIYAADIRVALARIAALLHPAVHHKVSHPPAPKKTPSGEISTGISLLLAYAHGDAMTAAKIRSEQTVYLKAISKYYSGTALRQRDALVVKQTNAMVAAANQLANLKAKFSAAQSYAGSVTSNLAGFASLQNVDLNSGSGIVGGLNSKLGRLRSFASMLTKLRQRGVSTGIIQQIVDMGPDTGYQYAAALVGATAATISAVNSANAQVSSVSASVGRSAALAVYGVDIAKGLTSQEKSLQSLMKRLGSTLGHEAVAWFRVPKSKVPRGYASGTRNATRGWHMVGEDGPEMLYFHGGESVIPVGSSGRGRFGGGVYVENLNVNFKGQPLHTKAEIGRTVKEAIAYTERRGN